MPPSLLISAAQRNNHPRNIPFLSLQRRPMDHKLLKTHIPLRAQSQVNANSLSHLQGTPHCILESAGYLPIAITSQEDENILASHLRFMTDATDHSSREKCVDDALGVERDEKGGVVDNEEP